MFEERTIQDGLTLSGPSSGQSVTQHFTKIVDTFGYEAIRIRTDIKEATNVELDVQTAISPEGPWSTLYTLSAAAEVYHEVECDNEAKYQLQRFVRWQVTSTNTNWKIFFTMLGTFEKDETSGTVGIAQQVGLPMVKGRSLSPSLSSSRQRQLAVPGAIPGRVFQPHVTVSGDANADTVYMDYMKWFDTRGFRRLIVSAEVFTRTNCTLTLETADCECGPWSTALTINATGVSYLQAEENATNKLERFVRWKIVSTNTNWEICFWIGAELKE